MKIRTIMLLALLTTVLVTITGSAQTKKKKGPPKYTVTANTVMRLRLNDSLTSKKAKVGDQFRSTVVDPVYAKGFQVIPAGSIVIGHITHVVRASRKSNAGSLNVAFSAVQLPNERTYALNGSASAVFAAQDGSGSSKKRNVAFIAGGAVVGGLINGVAGAGIGAGAGVGAALLKKGKEAEVKPGTEFSMILNRSLLLPEYKGGD